MAAPSARSRHCFALAIASPANAEDAINKGKTIRLVVGTPTGGGYYTYARLSAADPPTFIPGKPAIVVLQLCRARPAPRQRPISTASRRRTAPSSPPSTDRCLRLMSSVTPGAVQDPEGDVLDRQVAQTADVLAVWHTTCIRTIADASSGWWSWAPTRPAAPCRPIQALLNATVGTHRISCKSAIPACSTSSTWRWRRARLTAGSNCIPTRRQQDQPATST